MKLKKLKIIVIICLIIVGLYSYFIEPNKLVLKAYTLELPNWNKSLDGLKIGVVSDLHIGSKHVSIKTVKKAVKLLNANSCDVVFILGDFDAKTIENSNISKKEISDSLKEINTDVIAVLGNHDYEPSGVVEPILKDANIKLLKNSETNIYYNKTLLRIYGVKDWWHANYNVKDLLGDFSCPTILLSHNPDIFPQVPNNVSLTLSGHTHGGEIVLPIIGAVFVPSIYSQKYAKGLVIENNKHLFVTSGIASLSRFRLFNPPEVVILNLYSQTENSAQNTLEKHGISDLFTKYFINHLGWKKG